MTDEDAQFLALLAQMTPTELEEARRLLMRYVLAVRPGNATAAPQAPGVRPALRIVKTGGRNR